MSVFIDRLYLNQEFHGVETPNLFNGHVARFDDDGVQEWMQPSAAVLEGTYDTRILAKSFGGRSFLRGNPGRFGRPDNVFNLDWQQTWEKANRLAEKFGLPLFTHGTPSLNVSDRDRAHGVDCVWTGATVSAIDATSNFATGSKENAFLFLQWLEGQHIERVRGGVGRQGSVRFGDGNGLQVEAYYKADEMIDHAKNDHKRNEIKKSQLWQWLNDLGVIRLEVRAKRNHLRDRNLGYSGAITMEKIKQLYDDKTSVIRRISNDVDAFDFTKLPLRMAGIAREYLAGAEMRSRMPKSSFYKARRELLSHGIDIATPNKIRTILPRVKVIELKPLTAPDWYWKNAA
ncbi:phage/plasmid replication domain-containing protein [Herminiimonas contaminans]|uniref:Uncharacterized protein n=1 Tax=Herminiimonas contaminans TaxID=1111140 RepID=A0ABS0EY84_9BURK|nr:phage/plasmid replication protein [Herminiimonas contaminans]MBF8179802.1 hypothetical protein [Herminiimonas contaminans]